MEQDAGSLGQALSDESVDCEWSRAAEDEGGEAGEVEQVALIAGRSELCAGGSDGHELDGAEPVTQMDGKDGDQEECGHRDTDEWDECSGKNRDAAKEFDENGEPCHEVRCWDT